MNRCFACKYYDSSVDCCNGDDVCYMDGLNQGYYEAFKIFSEHCQSGHLIIGYDDQGDFRGCFLRETGKFNRENWKCCFEKCPLLNK